MQDDLPGGIWKTGATLDVSTEMLVFLFFCDFNFNPKILHFEQFAKSHGVL